MKIVDAGVRGRAIERCRERGVVIPTFAQQRDPSTLDPAVVKALAGVDMDALDPLNLFRINWRNASGSGAFGSVNALEIPTQLSGVPARIVGLVGERFPTGTHKVGAAFGCLVPRLVAGEFDPVTQRAVWPSTGNYCRGGVFDSALLGCASIAILPEEMSRERFRWLERMGAEIIATPGCESNVKEIFDACREMRENRPEAVIFNQFEEFGNYLWHYGVTGPAGRSRLSIVSPAVGSAGSLGERHGLGGHARRRGLPASSASPRCRIVAAEALQCPTLLQTGFGGHRIEGIGDKHVPWIHNVRNTDMVVGHRRRGHDAAAAAVQRACGPRASCWRGVSPETTCDSFPCSGSPRSATCWRRSRRPAGSTSTSATSCSHPSPTPWASTDAPRRSLRRTTGDYDAVLAEVDFERACWAPRPTTCVSSPIPTARRSTTSSTSPGWSSRGARWRSSTHCGVPAFWLDLQAQLPEWDEAIAAFNAETGVPETLTAMC